MYLFNIKDGWVNNDGYYVSKWKWEQNPDRFRAELIKGATKRASGFIPVSGGKPEHHNFKLITNPNKIIVGADNSNYSDELLLLLSSDSSARSNIGLNTVYTTALVVNTISAANAAGNEIALIVKFEKNQRLVLKQTGRYDRWEIYHWNGSELKYQKLTNDEEFKYVVQN